MIVKHMQKQDRDFVFRVDRHVNDAAFERHVLTGTGYVMWENGAPVGLMHHCVIWDTLPFLNLIYIAEDQRGKGFASQAILFWEQEMRQQGYTMVLISTQADENAQHLYRKLGYLDCGGLVFQNTPFDQPMELFFRKVL